MTNRIEDLTTRLAAGQPIEVAWLTNQGTIIRHGWFERVGHDAFGAEAVFWRHAGRSYDVPRSALRYIAPVNPQTIAGSYRPGERVIVRRYNVDYLGVVQRVARSRLIVQITLGAGTSRERRRDLTVPALDAHRPTPGVLL